MDAQFCLKQIRGRFPDLNIQDAVPVTDGWDSLVLEINGEWIFRFPRRPDVVAQHRKEAALLPALANTLPVRVPHFEYIAPEFVGYRKIEGEQLAGRHITSENQGIVARQMADFLSALHQFPVERTIELGMPAGDQAAWRQKYVELQQRTNTLLAARLNAAEQQKLDQFWEQYLRDDRHFQFAPTLIHGDLTGDHILYNPERETIAGIIDWGDAMIGDPALDFAGFVWDYGNDFAALAAQMYTPEIDSNFIERAGFYARIVPIYTIEYGIEIGDKSHVENGVTCNRTQLQQQAG